MPKLSPKENITRLLKYEEPEYVPSMMGALTFGGPLKIINQPGLPTWNYRAKEPEGGWRDMWGVPYVANEESGYGGMPKPGVAILQDVAKWDKVIKKPELKIPISEIDWDAMAAEDLSQIDRSQTFYDAMCGISPFLQLVAFMGFTEALIALIEEPESVKELLNYVCDFYIPILEKTMKHYKPDMVNIGDDTCSKHDPFFSERTYREIFLPIYQRAAKVVTDNGASVEFHVCGKAERFVPYMCSFGTRIWEPAQTMNNLVKAKRENRDIIICGGYELELLPGKEPDEEAIRQSVRDAIDSLAPGGQFIFGGGFMGSGDMEVSAKVNGYIFDEYEKYGMDFYK
ncbi:MAG: hypothetical protein LBC69_03565 [Eubacteriaceae bacterium]|jgi:hypothetical protein|nr:hypothetical protein [Eubacteriaceae bacterium]